MRLGRKIGYFRHRLTIQKMCEVPDDNVGIIRTFDNVNTVWGNLEPFNGAAYFNGEQLDKSLTHKCLIRFYPGLTTENWIYFDYRRFRIRFIYDMFERERFSHLMLEEDALAPPQQHPLLMLLRSQ